MKTELITRAGKAAPLAWQEMDANFQRLMYFSGTWAAGTYEANEVVIHDQSQWICTAATTTQEPSLGAFLGGTSDWFPIAISPWGIGEMTLDAPDTGFPNLGGGWVTVTYDSSDYDQNTVLTPATGEFQVASEGVWELQFTFAMLHNSTQSGRVTTVRIYDITNGIGGGGLNVGIGRNQEATQSTASIWFTADGTNIGNTYRIELGGGDSVTVDEMTAARLALKKLV